MIRALRSFLAYRRFQKASKAAERRAQASHGRVNAVRAERTKLLHAALAGGRK